MVQAGTVSVNTLNVVKSSNLVRIPSMYVELINRVGRDPGWRVPATALVTAAR
jgi:hypothetical protein